ncbi:MULTISPECIES: QcrA and Rieske domain-containing protein [Kitasatospora]|uniref:QcrA and Rieske domain-containing protein n=1 Tax=Kitasatospora TaxID=2063 RepID=UPI00068DBAB4|nr:MULTISPECIES: Rieske (2Fe-2S) protein [unclassified Kitasatospora]WAL75671.1 Rieske (2Fe-2S) protein [Kitasatospora sp. YST-16]WNW41737.1 Rieske (2Fe-2S) protein [Streptomyces sp. Li-HN-5-13]
MTGPGNSPEPYGTADPDGHRAERAALKERISADSLTTRRDYLRIVATVSGGLVVGSTVVSAGVLHRHGDGSAAPLKVADRIERGEAVSFDYPGEDDRAMAIRLPDGTLVGYSTVCTHLACGVLWRRDHGSDGDLYCPCHEGQFDSRTGEVTGGPPPRPLPKVVVVEDAQGAVWAIGTARSGEAEEAGLCRGLTARNPALAEAAGCATRRSGR